MLISVALPWCILDLPMFVLPILGAILHNPKMVAIGTTWFGILHLPFMNESLIIVPIGLFIHGKLFPHDKITRYRLLRLLVQAKRDFKTTKAWLKNKFRRKKNGKGSKGNEGGND